MEVKTRVLQPNKFNQQRCEFLLPQDVLYSSFRLANVGANAIVAGGNQANTYFSGISGVCALIKNMYLYNNNELIAQIQNFNRYSFLRMLRKSNSQNYSLQQVLKEASYGIKLSRANGLDISPNLVSLPATVSALNTGVIHLQEFFPFLAENPMLDARNLQLKLVIEWASLDPAEGGYVGGNIFYENVATASVSNISALNIYTPELILDMYGDEMEMKEQKWIYHDVVYDSFGIGANNQNLYQRVNALNGLYVDDLFVMNLPRVGSHFTGKNCSMAAANEIWQINVNSENLLPSSGLQNSNEKISLLTDLYGPYNIPYGGSFNFPDTTSRDNVYSQLTNINTQLPGQISPAGFKISRIVNDLYINFQKSNRGTAGSAQLDASVLLVFAHVIRSKVVTKSGMVM